MTPVLAFFASISNFGDLQCDANYIRPWSDPSNPQYAAKLLQVTLPPADNKGRPDYQSGEQVHIKVNFHYMVGNHDWYYHLDGKAFDQIRREMIEKMGLSNPVSPFPHEAGESPLLKDLFDRYKVLAHHGDRYDQFNFDREKGRNYGTIGDAFTMDVCNRFPIEVQNQYGDHLPAGFVDSLTRTSRKRFNHGEHRDH